ncbi:hypothetical protein CERSUDRAFT_77549 [Gelatoporia subvermispora B]|uniref:Peptidase C14 caspase domain-containing protein n=1 Tax=Ceriporiopsis subvermispora (strain B) TaxID=914234 RepID=M2QJE8_CERS8|nr:hypothetical protein CERSUDRAFT_77549 [Gelatoporia subvermispora B]
MKRGLVIGIGYAYTPSDLRGDYPPLRSPHQDATEIKRFLIGSRVSSSGFCVGADAKVAELYGYDEHNVVLMLEQPTRRNIILQLAELVRDAQPGDTFVFFFSGHSEQIPSGTETALMKVTILPEDHDGLNNLDNLIVDDRLREILVGKLPTGARLVAIFDCCHSETLLGNHSAQSYTVPTHHRVFNADLRHYRCNEMSYAKTTYETEWERMRYFPRRRNALKWQCSQYMIRAERKHSMEFSAPANSSARMRPNICFPRRSMTFPTTLRVLPSLSGGTTRHQLLQRVVAGQDVINSSVTFCSSPTTSVAECCGDCPARDQTGLDAPDVYTISACKDRQLTFESQTGKFSFAHTFMAYLRTDNISTNRDVSTSLIDIYTGRNETAFAATYVMVTRSVFETHPHFMIAVRYGAKCPSPNQRQVVNIQ